MSTKFYITQRNDNKTIQQHFQTVDDKCFVLQLNGQATNVNPNNILKYLFRYPCTRMFNISYISLLSN